MILKAVFNGKIFEYCFILLPFGMDLMLIGGKGGDKIIHNRLATRK